MDESQIFRDKTVLITGGTGTFGRAFAHNLLAENLVSKVIIFSRDEWKQWEMQKSDPLFRHPKIRFFLGDVRDEERLRRAFHEVQIVIHAAALKQVPAAEYNPSEFIKTNINGAMNLINAAIDTGVERVVALSSDKAVNPINLYGATKLCAEKLFVAAKSYVGKRVHPLFSVVRYGNVMGSRGSLLPLWQDIVKSGSKELPITDTRMTRFWITIDEAVNFVKKSCCRMEGAEIFVPKSPSVRIVDLANAFVRGVSHTITGIRPGEKIHELLISHGDAGSTYECEDYYCIRREGAPAGGKKVGPDFVLSSENNPLFTEKPEVIERLLSSFT